MVAIHDITRDPIVGTAQISRAARIRLSRGAHPFLRAARIRLSRGAHPFLRAARIRSRARRPAFTGGFPAGRGRA